MDGEDPTDLDDLVATSQTASPLSETRAWLILLVTA
jgi:hypothetical protein